MKKDDMLKKIIKMTAKLTKYQLQEKIDKVLAANQEAEKWISDCRKRDQLQLAKMTEQAEERVELLARIAELEATNKELAQQIETMKEPHGEVR